MEEQILNTQQVAEMIGVKPAYVYQLKARHAIPFHKKGKLVRYLKSEILEWIKSDSDEDSVI